MCMPWGLQPVTLGGCPFTYGTSRMKAELLQEVLFVHHMRISSLEPRGPTGRGLEKGNSAGPSPKSGLFACEKGTRLRVLP